MASIPSQSSRDLVCWSPAPGRAGGLVTIAEGSHPFPSRTRSLSPPAPTILQGQPCGTIGRRRPSRPRQSLRRPPANPITLHSIPTQYRVSRSRAWACGRVGDYSGGVPPVPFPNTVVKPSSPDDTAGAALWDNRTSPALPPAPVAGERDRRERQSPSLIRRWALCYFPAIARAAACTRPCAR
jgi:hypothetical protein